MTATWWVDLEDLNHEQRGIISLPPDGCHLITGPPGSGKTNLLLLRANYLALGDHPNVMVVVFTRTLQEFLLAGGQQYDFSPSKIKTHRKWQLEFLRQHGVHPVMPPTFDEQRVELNKAIRKVLDEKRKKHSYDAVLLDEAQDFFSDEICMFAELSPVLFAVADARQKIYAGAESLTTVRSLVHSEHRLTYHYRNGRKVCQVADSIGSSWRDYEPLLPTSRYDESARPSSVERVRCPDISHQGNRIIDGLRLQLTAYPGEFLGVLAPRREDVASIWHQIQASDVAEMTTMQGGGETISFDAERPVCLCTVHAAKGVEFRTVHLAGCEFLRAFSYEVNVAFTAITRAKTSLTVYQSEGLPGYVEKALKSLEATQGPPPLDSIFGKRRA